MVHGQPAVDTTITPHPPHAVSVPDQARWAGGIKNDRGVSFLIGTGKSKTDRGLSVLVGAIFLTPGR